MIPLRLEELQPSKSLRYFISMHQWLDAFPPPLESHLNVLTNTIKMLLGIRQDDVLPPALPAEPPPLPALEPRPSPPHTILSLPEEVNRLSKWRMIIVIIIASFPFIISLFGLIASSDIDDLYKFIRLCP